MPNLVSPGSLVTVTNEAFSATSGPGTIPLIVLATHSNKTQPNGTQIAEGTKPARAGEMLTLTGQRELLNSLGTPVFYNVQGTPLHGYELNEYGLATAHSLMEVVNTARVIRADIDLGALTP